MLCKWLNTAEYETYWRIGAKDCATFLITNTNLKKLKLLVRTQVLFIAIPIYTNTEHFNFFPSIVCVLLLDIQLNSCCFTCTGRIIALLW